MGGRARTDVPADFVVYGARRSRDQPVLDVGIGNVVGKAKASIEDAFVHKQAFRPGQAFDVLRDMKPAVS
ncbi:hypothetical protein ACH79_39560 [Bradyrhizobium sp. CCBAU 051011]|nr:hypothetical protein ACH79_39560 [Bradyrhizobium sp. CCBAU 051011]